MVDVQWLIGGEAGYGIMTTGVMMSKIFTRLGLSVFDYVEYPSLIRGGHNAYYVRGSDEEIFSQKQSVDILVCLNKETLEKHKNEFSSGSSIIYDPNSFELDQKDFSNSSLIPVPLLDLTKQAGADKLMINTVAVGASLALFYSDYSVLESIIKDAFGKKGEEIVLENVNTSKAGFDYVVKNHKGKSKISIEKKVQDTLLLSGAESLSLGAIKAGLKFAAIYPMTPINSILTTLVANSLDYNIVVKEPEDEISGINMAIGASFAGARSMVATSGGGFCLMVEGLGLTAQTETPLVIVEGQRPGPGTGFPTWTSQTDLQFVLNAAHGEFPRIVVAPGDVLETFECTLQAFNLAEKYQLPVIILVDKYLMESHKTVKSSKLKVQSYKIERGKLLKDEDLVQSENYRRYAFVEDGVSPRSLPGEMGGIALNGSDEHDERGLYDETSENRIRMVDKRFKKLESALADIPSPKIIGDNGSSLTIISWGSTKLPALEAIKRLKNEGISVGLLNLNYLNPFPSDVVSETIKNSKKVLIIEGNKTGQLENLIREKTGLQVQNNFRKYDGRPFYPEEIAEKVKTMLSS